MAMLPRYACCKSNCLFEIHDTQRSLWQSLLVTPPYKLSSFPLIKCLISSPVGTITLQPSSLIAHLTLRGRADYSFCNTKLNIICGSIAFTVCALCIVFQAHVLFCDAADKHFPKETKVRNLHAPLVSTVTSLCSCWVGLVWQLIYDVGHPNTFDPLFGYTLNSSYAEGKWRFHIKNDSEHLFHHVRATSGKSHPK